MGDIAVLLIGLTSFIEINFVGRLFASDALLALALIPLIISRGRRLLGKWPTRLIGLAALWLSSQIVTDIIRGTPSEDYLRGWAKITFFITSFAALYLLVRTDRRRLLVTAGFALSRIIQYYIHPNIGADDDPWKWAFGWTITVLLLLTATIAYGKQRTIFAYLCVAATSVANLSFNLRSTALICFATLSCSLLAQRKQVRASTFKLTVIVGAIVATSWAFGQVYSFAAGGGLLGQRALEKYEDQANGDFGILLGGRAEGFASIQAIIDSPLIGHGSWARDASYVELQKNAMVEHGYRPGYTQDDLIPSHSCIFGAWVESGLLGAIFWVAVLALTLTAIKFSLSYPSGMRILNLFFGLSLLWDTFFSPFGAQQRFIISIYLVFMLSAANYTKKPRPTLRALPLS